MTKVSPAPPNDISAYVGYDRNTGAFTRLIGKLAGSRADWKNHKGYSRLRFNGREYAAHRLAWFIENGEWPSMSIDHVNGIRSDNRIANLRLATTSQNQANRKTMNSLARGVTLHRETGKYQAQIMCSGRYHYLGLYPTVEEAHAAYSAKAIELFGEYSRVSNSRALTPSKEKVETAS